MKTFKKNQCFRYECPEYISWYKYSGEKDKKSKLLICETYTMYKNKDRYQVSNEELINPIHLRQCVEFSSKKFSPTKKAIGFLVLTYCYRK